MTLDQHEVEGYRICGCGALVVEEMATMQGGRCGKCWEEHRSALTVVEVIHRGQRTSLSLSGPRKGGSSGSKRKAKAVERAKLQALKRLRMIYPEMYDMLYDEERHRRGLSPIPRRGHVTHEETVATFDTEQVYAALTESEMP